MPYKYFRPYYFFFLLCSFCLLVPIVLSAQTKDDLQYNRFQYHQYKWNTFHTDAYHLYYPIGHDSLAARLANEVPKTIALIKHRMGTTLSDVPNIIIYPSADQLYESNIGISDNENYTLPTVVLKGSRIVLAYTGDFDALNAQLMEALARAIWEKQFRNQLAEQVKGAASDDKIPFWFKEGAIRYFAHQWSIQSEDELSRTFQKQKFQNWQEVIAYQPRLAGQAFCYFLSDQYYPLAVTQLFTQLKQKKDLARCIRLIAKSNLDSLFVECFDFYQQRFSTGVDSLLNTNTTLTTIPHAKGVVQHVLLSPSKTHIAYTVYQSNKRLVYLYNTVTKKDKKLYSYALPPWIDNYQRDPYPLLHWKGDHELVIAVPVKGKIQALHFGVNGNAIVSNKLYGTDGITNLNTTNRNQYTLSAYRKGQSDIVNYDANRDRYYPLTNDPADDTYLADNVLNKPYFLSNRKSVDTGNYYQGIYILADTVQELFVDTLSYIKWDKLTVLVNGGLLATETSSGKERFVYIPNTKQNSYETLGAYQPFQYSSKSNTISFYNATRDSITITQYPFDEWMTENTATNNSTNPWLVDYHKRAALRAEEDSILNAAKDNSPSFLEGVLVPKGAKEQEQKIKDSVDQSLVFNPKRVKQYILQLHSAYFTAQVNNDYFINRYQPYLNYQGQFKFPDVGGLTQGGFTDLFENHHFNIAYRLPAGNEGSDFFVKYRNTAKKLNWGLTYFRKVEQLQPNPDRDWKDEDGNPYPNTAKVKTHYYEISFYYPISYYLSIGFDQAFRNDRTIFLATDKYSLHFKDIKSLWSISSISVKLNKLNPTVPLLYKGYTAKLFLDAFTGLSGGDGTATGSTIQLSHHQPLYKYITLVTKLQAGYSGGSTHVLYNLGGVDNNLTVKTDSSTIFQKEAPYTFQTLITPFRGQLQNSLYGNQYLLFNADCYFPIFQTLIPIETPLSFINHLQLGMFTDIGTASETWRKPKMASIWQQSLGFSARTTLANYPIRVDVAWPNNFSNKPVWYLSLNIQ